MSGVTKRDALTEVALGVHVDIARMALAPSLVLQLVQVVCTMIMTVMIIVIIILRFVRDLKWEEIGTGRTRNWMRPPIKIIYAKDRWPGNYKYKLRARK